MPTYKDTVMAKHWTFDCSHLRRRSSLGVYGGSDVVFRSLFLSRGYGEGQRHEMAGRGRQRQLFIG